MNDRDQRREQRRMNRRAMRAATKTRAPPRRVPFTCFRCGYEGSIKMARVSAYWTCPRCKQIHDTTPFTGARK